MRRRVGRAFPQAAVVAGDAFVAVAVTTCGDLVAEGAIVGWDVSVAVSSTSTSVATAGSVGGGVTLSGILVGVGGGAEGSGVMAVLAERLQAESVRMSSAAAPA
jgi:hypothetical protein